jgi:hypothetical protein
VETALRLLGRELGNRRLLAYEKLEFGMMRTMSSPSPSASTSAGATPHFRFAPGEQLADRVWSLRQCVGNIAPVLLELAGREQATRRD